MVRLYSVILFLLVTLGAHAQERRGRVSAVARSGEEEILLRWAPHDPLTWKLGNKYGYTIERFTIGKNGRIDSTGQWPRVVLTAQPVRPWPLDEWERIAVGDHYAAIAAQAIYGEDFEVSGPTGGTVAMVNQVKEERNRFGFALFAADHSDKAAQAAGLRWPDKTVKKGEVYLYRVAVAPHAARMPIDTALVTAEAILPAPLPPPAEVSVQFGDQVASIQWNGFYFSDTYVSYCVEKSEDGTHFSPVNDLPVVHGDRPSGKSQQIVLMDSLAQNGKRYYYRVRGITAFSEVGPPSEVVVGQGVVSLAGVYPVIDTIRVDHQTATLRWSFPDSLRQFVVGYRVTRSASLNGSYVPLHPALLKAPQTTYIDSAPLSTNYYRVQAMGPDSTFTASAPYMIALEDSLPPQLPERFTGLVKPDGRVHLHWQASPSPDVLGYRLFRANDPNEEFVMVSSQTVQDTTFLDSVTVATLTERVYYRIVAVDKRFNASDYSDVLMLKRPDIVPPVPAQLTSLTATQRGVQLHWMPSPSADATEYVLLRWHATSSGFQTIQRFAVGDSTYAYLDSLVKPNTVYRYMLNTWDDDGLHTAHPSREITTLKVSPPEKITQLVVEADREARQVRLRWQYSPSQEVAGYRIFRAAGDGPLRHYQFSSDQPRFTDRRLAINRRYRYAVQAVREDGHESKLSTEVQINY